MKKVLTLSIFIGALAIFGTVSSSGNAAAASKTYKVVSVTDGDTIRVKDGNKTVPVRMIGIDAPELSSKATTKAGCFAQQSKTYLSRMLTGKYVTLRADVLSGNKDKYGRLLRYVYLGVMDVDYLMVFGGYAREYKYYANNYVFRNTYLAAQASAKRRRIGLWNLNVCKMNK
ncbi:thermonuclease family protein [Candidatus Saccharibacteria bacterium]|nr:thermonuclease family protein [Candidatus Saccharibacteria bacterium]